VFVPRAWLSLRHAVRVIVSHSQTPSWTRAMT
jgi:hypothetical protein